MGLAATRAVVFGLFWATTGCSHTRTDRNRGAQAGDTSPEESGLSDSGSVGVASGVDGSVAEPQQCAGDSSCSTGFCDLGTCVQEYKPRHYGWPCDPTNWPKDDPLLASKLNPCGGYLCRDMRCRSCQSDADCEAGTCFDGVLEGAFTTPGFVCGSPP
jgi:hypothetical protein